MVDADNVSERLKARPFPLTQVTSEKAVKSAYSDIMTAYVVPFLGSAYQPEEGSDDETLYDKAVLSLTYARLLWVDIAKMAYSTARPLKGDTSSATTDDSRRAVSTYRRLGVACLLSILRLQEDNAGKCLRVPRYSRILGEDI